ncbi:MAG: DUF4365 domain-containing protein [Acidobacteriota bacterium]
MKRPRVLPQRPQSHIVGDKAVDIFVAACDPAWVVAPVTKDYGLDLRIEIARSGYVTGEEFVVQVKGRTSVNVANGLLPHAHVRQNTINYWIAKLSPTMIAVVDTTTNTVFYDWLEHCYPSYPNAVQLDGEIALPLRHSSAEHDLRKEVTAYLHRYYASISQDMERLSKGIYLANLLFSISALYRLVANAVIDLQRIEPSGPEDLRKLIHDFCFAFACHDSLMGGLRAGAFGHRPTDNSRFFSVVEHKLQQYDEVRSKFLVYRGENAEGDLMFETKYKEITASLLPMFHVLEDIQEVLGLAQALNRALPESGSL